MSQRLRNNLKKKGWPKKDIEKAISSLERARAEVSSASRLINFLIFLGLLIIIILGNVLMSLSLIPLLLTLEGVFLITVVFLLGLIMGALFEIATRSIGFLEKEHHLALGIIMPFLGLLNIAVMVVYTNLFGTIQQSPYVLAIAYGVSFLLPYAFHRFVSPKQYSG